MSHVNNCKHSIKYFTRFFKMYWIWSFKCRQITSIYLQKLLESLGLLVLLLIITEAQWGRKVYDHNLYSTDTKFAQNVGKMVDMELNSVGVSFCWSAKIIYFPLEPILSISFQNQESIMVLFLASCFDNYGKNLIKWFYHERWILS